jgi:hypothetical protein
MAKELKNAHAFLVLEQSQTFSNEYAYRLASEILCTEEDENKRPCGKCASCRMAENKTHPDILVFGRAKVSVDDVREMIRQAYLAPNSGDKKVFVLEGIDKFNAQSQNAMLKILEEPPKGVYFVLTGANKNAVLPTVLSRTFAVLPKERDADENFEKYLSGDETKESKEILKQYIETYPDAKAEEFPTESVLKAYALANDFYGGAKRNAVSEFPRSREEAAIYFRAFMLFSRNIFVYKLTNGKIPENESADFKKICAKTSARSAAAYYEIFETAYLNNDSFANINALYAYLSEQI